MIKINNQTSYAKYTAGSYADAFMSMPISVARGISGLTKLVLKEKTPEFFDLDKTQQNSPVYQSRKTLREKLDTEPGMKFLKSNAIGTLPFFLVGMPAAEGLDYLIKENFGNMPELAQYITNSLGTLTAQMITGYTVFMGSEVWNNTEKYVGENEELKLKNIKPKKVLEGFAKAAKAFLTFDLTYVGMKTAGQTACLTLGKNPWKASAITDMLAFPVFWSVAVALGLKHGIIETKKSEEKND
ncbi:hypothetical protein COV11_04550 [Candidatus Woesearchaeota archaeon CG10_big_fil_rev_8_21_14_0_10_30_7]|nr:MAG: hypothetical protein COV11_04550 [Candidatus Woesearchaeota archaeon CG10_big_fil_rev_8_21_14_0_10_30_7]